MKNQPGYIAAHWLLPLCSSMGVIRMILYYKFGIMKVPRFVARSDLFAGETIWIQFQDEVFLYQITNVDYKQYIVRNPEVMLGKPTIKGTRITIELRMRKLAGGYTLDELLNSYPHLTKEQIFAALEYVADLVANEEVFQVA